MVQRKQQSTKNISEFSVTFFQNIKNNPSEKILFQKRISKHNISKNHKESSFIYFSCIHRGSDTFPIYKIPAKIVRSKNNRPSNQPKRKSVFKRYF